MLSVEMMQQLFAYNRWSMAKIFAGAEKLTSEQWDAPVQEGQRNLHQLLFHNLRTEWFWRQFCVYGELKERAPLHRDIPDLSALIRAWREEEHAMRAFLETISADQLAASVTIKQPDGSVSHALRWVMLMHTALHTIQHRTEAAEIITAFGQSPGDLDFIFFMAETAQG